MILDLEEMSALVGRVGGLKTPSGMVFPVRILSARYRFGLMDYKIEPIWPDGMKPPGDSNVGWVRENAVELFKEPKKKK